MESLNTTQFESMIERTEILSRDDFGENVFRAEDGLILKLFRPWSTFSSSRLLPYAVRFARAARELKRRDVPTIEVFKLYSIPRIRRHMIGYRELTGDPLRSLMDDESRHEELLARLTDFCADLHRKGIYFRGLHLDNIIVTENGEFGLIDLSGSKFSRRPLGPFRRARNFRPLVREAPDRIVIERYGPRRFANAYLEAAQLSKPVQRMFLKRLRRVDNLFQNAEPGENGQLRRVMR